MTSIDDLQQQLATLREKAALPAVSKDQEERARLREEIAKAKARIAENEAKARRVQEDETFEELERKHAAEELHRIDTEAGMIVLRSPTVAKGRHFQAVALKGKLSPDAIEDFVKPCVVYPDAEQLEQLLERYTLLAPALCQFAQEFGSASAERRAKK